MKLFDNGIIYPISNSQWVSPIHAVPKKSGFTVVKNKNKELVQTRLPTRRSEFASTIGSLMLQLVRTIFHSPSLIKCLKVWRATSVTVSWTVTRGIIRFLLLRGSRKDYVYMSIWDICVCGWYMWVMGDMINLVYTHVENLVVVSFQVDIWDILLSCNNKKCIIYMMPC